MTSRSASSFGGIIAEEKLLSGTPTTGAGAASLGSYFQGVASYLPSSIKKQLHITPSSHHHSYDEDHDIVLGADFDKYETPNGEMHLCLMVSYNNGFQVWDLQHPDGKREIVSVREPTPIKSIKFIPNPIGKEPPNSLLAGKRPLLAVVSAEESSKFPRSNVKFYSLKSNEYINILRFKSPVYTVECNQRILLVGLRDNIYGFDLVTMERVLNLPCYPSPLNNSVMALGSRWLAYAANQIIPPPSASTISPHSTHQGSAANPTNYVEVAKDVATDLAKEVAQGLFYLGDMGRKTVSNYLYPEDGSTASTSNISNLQTAPAEYKDTEHAGTIIIYDIVAKKTILHFRAHSQPLSVLRFDPSGTLLVSSSVDGHNFNVFQIGLSGTSGASGGNIGAQEITHRHLYKLVRGVTNATIQDISFSADSKWMAISSTRGTTHIYAINPQGGPVNVLTHVPASNRPADMLAPHKPDLPVPLVTLSVCNRIKTGVAGGDESTSRNTSAIGSTSRFVGFSPADERLLVFSKNGLLTLYQLSPHSPHQTDPDPLSLQLALSPMSEADVGRRTKWAEYRQSVKDVPEKESTTQQEADMKWLSNVEISTHSPHLRLLWIGCPQFSFRTYQSTVPSSSSPTSRLHSDLSTSPQNSNFDDFMNVGVLNGAHTTSTTTTTTYMQPNTVTSANTSSSNSNTSSTPAMGVLFDENAVVPTKRIDIRRYEPQPFKESLDDLHETTSSSPRTDDLIKEGLLDAISTPMVAANKPNLNSGFDLSIKQNTETTNVRRTEVKSSPPQPSPLTTTPSVPTHLSTESQKDILTRNITTSTSSLSSALTANLLNSESGSASTSIPNYYSRYNPSSIPYSVQTTSASTQNSPPTQAQASRELPPISPVRTSPFIHSTSSPLSPIMSQPVQTSTNSPRTSPLLPVPTTSATPASPSTAPRSIASPSIAPPSTASPSTASPSTASSSSLVTPVASPPLSQPTSSVTSQATNAASPSTTSPIPIASPARSIPTSNKSTHSPFSTSPPFPESELSQPPSKKPQPTSTTPPKKDEDEDEFSLVSRNPPPPTSSSSSKKKKKNKGKQKNNNDREHEEESEA